MKAAASGWLIIGGVLLWGLFAPPRHAGDAPGIRAFVTPDVTTDMWVGQEFEMDDDRLRAIELRPVALSEPAGRMRFELWNVHQGDRQMLFAEEVDASAVVRDGRYRFEFPIVDAARKRRFRLEIRASAAAPSRGVAFTATMGDRLDNAWLVLNNKMRWADLAFRTETTYGPLFVRLWNSERLSRPAAALIVLSLFGSWVFGGVVLRQLAQASPPPDQSASATPHVEVRPAAEPHSSQNRET